MGGKGSMTARGPWPDWSKRRDRFFGFNDGRFNGHRFLSGGQSELQVFLERCQIAFADVNILANDLSGELAAACDKCLFGEQSCELGTLLFLASGWSILVPCCSS
jgi:hypothetical protein